MKKTTIMSDTKGKLKKMITGVVFSDPYVFVTEFFQNSYRAKANRLDITYNIEDGYIIFRDNGKGLKKASNILTLDYSSWESTKEGFGIGFWSWLGFDIADLEENNYTEVLCKVRSNKIGFEISKLELLKAKLSVNIREIEQVDGFEVILHSELLKDSNVAQEIRDRIYSDGELMPYVVYFNGNKVEPKDILGEVSGDYIKDFSNRLFDARLTVSKSYRPIVLYYEKRRVAEYYYQSCVSGNIELKKGALTLKEPDRKDYARDTKFYKFKQKVEECSKELYKEFLENSNDDMTNTYANYIAEVLEVKDYEKLLEIDDIFFEVGEETRVVKEPCSKSVEELNNLINSRSRETELTMLDAKHSEIDIQNISKLLNILSSRDKKKWVQTEEIVEDKRNWVEEELNEEVLREKEELVIKGRVWKKLDETDLSSFEREDEEVETKITMKTTNKRKKKTSLLDVIRKERKKVWVRASEIEDSEDLIAKSKYYGLKVFIAKNILYENVFKNRGIAHISEVNTGITKRNIIKNIEIKSNKEKSVLQLLQPICSYYKLPYDTFLIGDLELYLETKLQDVVVHREVVKNTKDKIKIYGVTDGDNIVLDRKALRLKRFNLTQSDSFGKHEFRVLLSIINTVSHELAHFLYGTTDNTVEHYEKQDKIMEEIETLYNSL